MEDLKDILESTDLDLTNFRWLDFIEFFPAFGKVPCPLSYGAKCPDYVSTDNYYGEICQSCINTRIENDSLVCTKRRNKVRLYYAKMNILLEEMRYYGDFRK